MFRASLLFAVGSALLLVGAQLVGGPDQSRLSFYAVTLAGVTFHLLAWVSLGLALQDLARGRSVKTPNHAEAMNWAFTASIIGFGAGLLTFLVAALRGSGWWNEGWAFLIPYVPLVYGPPVMAQSALFLLGTSGLKNRFAAKMMVAGGGLLGVLAAFGLAGQAFFVSVLGVGILSLAGLTSFGYAAVAISWLREYLARQPVAPTATL